MTERPDGSTATAIGWGLVAVGVLASFFVAQADTPVGFWLSIGIANLGIGLGVLLLSLGYLVRAIWFLPGRSDLEPESLTLESADEVFVEECEWCGVVVQTPAIPCSAFTSEHLPIPSNRVSNAACIKALGDRGYLS